MSHNFTVDMNEMCEKLDTIYVTQPESKKQQKRNKTAYWGIELPTIQNDILDVALKANTNLVPLTKIHSTLLYVGKKDNENEKLFVEHESKECVLTITSFGISEFALCLKVDSIVFTDNKTEVPTCATIQHVTYALSEGTKAMDSINALKVNIIKFDRPIEVTGTVKRFLY